MYSTLDLNTLNNIHVTNSPLEIVSSPTKNDNNINNYETSAKSRSKTGCLTCKKRKRKCDEIHPTCTFCSKRGLSCEYTVRFYTPPNKKIDKVHKPVVSSTTTTPKSRNNSFTSSIDINELLSSINTDTDINTGQLISTSKQIQQVEEEVLPMYINLSSTFNLFLDDRGLKHLDFFENQVAPMISVSPQSSNYFLKTFFTLAITNESISNGLAAWGALFDNAIEGEDKYLTVNRYLQRGNELIHKNEISTNNDRFDSFIKLAYYLIVIGIHICSGDTKQWHDYFNRCVRLFKDYGGIVKFINDFKYSNDCKFLISNFQFHDVMSSETLKNGTICSMNNYNDLFKFNKILELDDYGIDPYQGCIQSVYLLLGEIMNSYVELKEERFNLNKLLNSSTSGDSGPVINNLRLSYLKRVNEKISELSNKIEYCQPNETQMNQLEEIDQANHLKLFELYRITCKMYLSLYLKQSQPISSEMQNYLINAQGIMDELIQTNLISSLNMSLLICGISCCNKFDRQNLNDKFCSIYERYQVGNVKRIWDVVREAWRRNPYGIVCIDWLDICNDFGWKISMC